MKNYDGSVNDNCEELPKEVEKKWMAAISDIRSGDVYQKPRRKKPVLSIAFKREPEDTVVNFGETVFLKGDTAPVDSSEAEQELTISNLRVYDSPEDAGIASDELIMPELEELGGKFVLVDVDIKNINGETSGIGISSYVQPDFKHPGLGHDNSIPNITYFSSASGGIKNYDYTEMEGELKAQVGFFWNEEDLRSGNLQFTIVGDPEGNGEVKYLHMEVPPYTKPN